MTTKTCKFCGESGFHWGKTKKGNWWLFAPDGKMHICHTSDQDWVHIKWQEILERIRKGEKVMFTCHHCNMPFVYTSTVELLEKAIAENNFAFMTCGDTKRHARGEVERRFWDEYYARPVDNNTPVEEDLKWLDSWRTNFDAAMAAIS